MSRRSGNALADNVTAKIYDRELMSRFLGYAFRFKRQLFFVLTLLPILSAVQLLQPYLVKIAIDSHIVPKVVEGLDVIAYAFLGLLALEFSLRYWQNFSIQRLGQTIMKAIRTDIMTQMMRLSTSFYERNPVGKLTNRATNDVEALSEMVSAGIVAIISDVVFLLGIIAAMFYMSPKLALVTLVSIPIIVGGTILIRKKIRGFYRTAREKQSSMSAYMGESIGGMKEIQLYMNEAKNHRGFNELNRDYLKSTLSSNFFDAMLYSFVEVTGVIVVAVVIWFGSYGTLGEGITLGILIAFIEYINKMFLPIRDLSAKFAVMQSAMAAMEKIFNLIDEKPDLKKYEIELKISEIKGGIEFKDVSFAYKEDDYILKNVSFGIKPGEKIAIVGHTGAGKSSLIKLISRLYDAQKGEILIDGENIKHLPISILRKSVGVVLQDVHLFSGTIAENITLWDKDFTDKNVVEALKMVNAYNFVEKMPDGIHTKLEERGSNLSVGQRQLLSFARVIVRKPPVIIMDEATSSIDNDSERSLQIGTEHLLENCTAIIIAHRLSTIRTVDRIMVMHHGEIMEIGTNDELLAKGGLYAKLYKLQFGEE